MTKTPLAQWIQLVLRVDTPPARDRPALLAHRSLACGSTSSIGVSAQQLEQWLRDAVAVVRPSLAPSAPSSTSTPLVVALALPSCSVEESACMLLVASQPHWVFVPLDTRLPVARQYELLLESKANRLITWNGGSINTHTAATAPISVSTLPSLPSSALSLRCYQLTQETPGWLTKVSAKLPLYVLFTSGSTGRPKGVIGTRQGAYERVQWMQTVHPMDSNSDCVLRTTRQTFVDAVAEVLTAILSGVPLVHLEFPFAEDVNSIVLHQPSVFADAVAQYRVSRFTLVPSVLRLLLTAMENAPHLVKRLSSVQVVSVSGEALPLNTVERLFVLLPQIQVLNLYGSTEVSGDVTSRLLRASMLSDEETVKRWETYGVPISNWPMDAIGDSTQLKLIQCTDGDSQEICVAGGAVAAGYLRDGELSELPAQRTDDEDDASWFGMGDLCRVIHGELFLCGRRDRQIKVRGNRVQLEDFERALKQAASLTTRLSARDTEVVAITVDSGAVGQELVAVFVVEVGASEYARPCEDCELLEMDSVLDRELFERVEATFGALYVPRSVVAIRNHHFPRLSSGKINVKELEGLYDGHQMHQRTNHKRKANKLSDRGEDPEETILNLVQHSLGTSHDRITSEATWLALGGDSLKATLLSWELEKRFRIRITAAEILTMTIADLLKLCVNHWRKIASEATESDRIESHTFAQVVVNRPKEPNQPIDAPTPQEPPTTIVAWYSRYNQSSERPMIESGRLAASPRTTNMTIKISLVASVDLGKCIDASPLVVRTASGSLLAFIGSHSHKFVCLEIEALDSGSYSSRTLWTQTLDDRIEASATLSTDQGLVAVGTYSGSLYAMNVASGNIRWKFQVRDMIKSSAVIVDSLSLAIVGAYDQSLCGLDLKSGEVVWRVDVPGSVYSTPVYDSASQLLIVATTTGVVLAWRLSTRTDLTETWRSSLPAPVFSSLVTTTARQEGCHTGEEDQILLVGCADGVLYALDAKSGVKRWEFATEKPIFSSPSVFSTTEGTKWVSIGSHDGKLRKLAISTGELHWEAAVIDSEPIFASPFEATLSGQAGTVSVLCSATTNGRLMFADQASGELFPVEYLTEKGEQEQQFGEIFSSPVIVDGLCFVGTRNNELLVLKLNCVQQRRA